MCGFLIHSLKNNIKPSESLQLRGPDSFQEILFNNLIFKHWRLTIVGNNDFGSQPKFNQKLIMLFNGEIFNYKFLAKKFNLSKKSHFSDTECIFELFNKYKNYDDFIKLFNGHFSVVLYVKKDDSFVFFRDQMGVKPLYFFNKSKSIFLCSDLRTLVNFKKEKISKENFFEDLVFGGQTGERTSFSNIYSSLPGFLYLFKNGILKKKKIVSNLNFKTNSIEKIIEKNVKLQYQTDVHSAILVSSGIDSRIIKKKINEIGKIDSYTLFSKKLGLDSEDINNDYDTHKINVDPYINDIFFIKCLKAYSGIPAHDNFFALSYIYKSLSDKILKKENKKLKICYTGEGADEYFGGYGRYRAIAGYLGKKINKNDFIWISSLKKISKNWLYLMNSRLNVEELQWLQKHKKIDDIIEMHLQDYKINSKRDLLDEMKNYDQNTNLIYALKKQDISGMMSSVEVRVPFINQDFFNLSQKKKLVEIKKNITKNKLRKIAKKLNIMQNKKIGFPIRSIKNQYLNIPINNNIYFKKILGKMPDRIKSSITWANILNELE
jgi:asparagine synthase (glutamine-hydrolysing)